MRCDADREGGKSVSQGVNMKQTTKLHPKNGQTQATIRKVESLILKSGVSDPKSKSAD
ncbi:hypothetical protein TNCV_4004811 [Trichonephila clavipes]|nr:hypothetical protein TNCV_4004811 [Trichonephila clavipes]